MPNDPNNPEVQLLEHLYAVKLQAEGQLHRISRDMGRAMHESFARDAKEAHADWVVQLVKVGGVEAKDVMDGRLDGPRRHLQPLPIFLQQPFPRAAPGGQSPHAGPSKVVLVETTGEVGRVITDGSKVYGFDEVTIVKNAGKVAEIRGKDIGVFARGTPISVVKAARRYAPSPSEGWKAWVIPLVTGALLALLATALAVYTHSRGLT